VVKTPLPIDRFLAQIAGELAERGRLVLVAEPGAGKTTRVPPAWCESLPRSAGSVLVVEPRRLAARMAARRVAAEWGEPLGQRVGYSVRFEQLGSSATQLWFMTEGVLTRRLLDDPSLRGVSTVILDEFHERRLDADLALAWLRRLQQTTRPDLRLIVMSATLDAERLSQYLDAAVISVPGQLHPIEIEHRERPDSRPLWTRTAGAVRACLAQHPEGDLLVFLPGIYEIRKAAEELHALAEQFTICWLHGDLSTAEQDRAVSPSAQRKVILATNIAESSITIEGVRLVIDSGLARASRVDPFTGLAHLETIEISQASAEQRAGRAGRTAPGYVLRLYGAHDLRRRPPFDPPEIVRSDLTAIALITARLSPDRSDHWDWLDPPPEAAWSAAQRLLGLLGACDQGRLTEFGLRLAGVPLHPRLAVLIETGRAHGVEREATWLAAWLAEERIAGDPLDLIAPNGPAPSAEVRRAASALGHAIPAMRGALSDRAEEALALALLRAFPERVARRRAASADQVLMAGGGTATLSPACRALAGSLLLAVGARVRGDATPRIDAALPIRAEWLMELFPECVTERDELTWNAQQERVEGSWQLRYGELVIEESPRSDPSGPEVEQLLARQALQRGVEGWVDHELWTTLRARLEFAQRHGVPIEPDQLLDFPRLLRNACLGQRSFAALHQIDWPRYALEQMDGSTHQRLERTAPLSVTLASGRQTRVRYRRDQPPTIASRIQDFFGVTTTPTIAGGSVPLVVQLLAPNQRPVQVTTDLAGFWTKHYPALRQQLMRRYPKHAWPEKP
jgi:ATP-dependent helicase HrpB